MKRLIQITLTIGATLLGIVLLWVFASAVALFGGSLAISAALRPLVQRLEERGLGRGTAILACYIAVLGLLGLFFALGGLNVAAEVNVSAEQIPRSYDALRTRLAGGSALEQDLARGLPEDVSTLFSSDAAGPALVSSNVLLGLVGNLFSDAVFLLGALSLAFYWLTESTRFERLWLSFLPVDLRIRARDIWRNTETAVGAYIRTTVIATLLAGLWLYLLFSAFRLPFPATVALLGGLSHLVPRVGPALALIPAVLVALTVSPTAAAVVLLGGAIIQIVIHHLAELLMRSQAIKVNPLLQVLLLLALVELGGVWAMVFAPPLAALVQVLYANLVAASTSTSQTGVFELLCERLERLRSDVAPDNKELGSALQRSDDLISQARQLLKR